jgi:hypothetical protein
VHPTRYSRDLLDLGAQIGAKEEKLEVYRKVCDEVWLVMYSLALPFGAFDMEVLMGQSVDSAFDHVRFLDRVSGNYVQLKG